MGQMFATHRSAKNQRSYNFNFHFILAKIFMVSEIFFIEFELCPIIRMLVTCFQYFVRYHLWSTNENSNLFLTVCSTPIVKQYVPIWTAIMSFLFQSSDTIWFFSITHQNFLKKTIEVVLSRIGQIRPRRSIGLKWPSWGQKESGPKNESRRSAEIGRSRVILNGYVNKSRRP